MTVATEVSVSDRALVKLQAFDLSTFFCSQACRISSNVGWSNPRWLTPCRCTNRICHVLVLLARSVSTLRLSSILASHSKSRSHGTSDRAFFSELNLNTFLRCGLCCDQRQLSCVFLLPRLLQSCWTLPDPILTIVIISLLHFRVSACSTNVKPNTSPGLRQLHTQRSFPFWR